jgi:hypothetical protein
MCWFPRRPGRLRIKRDDYEHIVRCGDCPGCLELDRRRLADRLCRRYPDRRARLWQVRVRGEPDALSRLSRNLHRQPSLGLEPGYCRAGPRSIVVLALERGPIARACRTRGLEHRIERVRLSRGRRAWRALTAGLLVSRSVYGEQVKRWYVRGLPGLDKLTWEVDRRDYERGYRRTSSPRAWARGRLVLVPPDLWRMRRADRSTLRRLLHAAQDPESVAQLVGLVAGVTARFSQSPLTSAAQPLLSREQVIASYQAMARRKSSVAPHGASTDLDQRSPSEGGGYRSSVHTQFDEPPKLLSDEQLNKLGDSGRPLWQEREKSDERLRAQAETAKLARTQTWIEQWAERMRLKLQGGTKDGS